MVLLLSSQWGRTSYTWSTQERHRLDQLQSRVIGALVTTLLSLPASSMICMSTVNILLGNRVVTEQGGILSCSGKTQHSLNSLSLMMPSIPPLAPDSGSDGVLNWESVDPVLESVKIMFRPKSALVPMSPFPSRNENDSTSESVSRLPWFIVSLESDTKEISGTSPNPEPEKQDCIIKLILRAPRARIVNICCLLCIMVVTTEPKIQTL